MDDKLIKEFQKSVKPAIEFIRNHGHPHCSIIVTYDNAEMLEGVISAPCKEESN